MKREEILLYINCGKVYIYKQYAKKEILLEIDTSSFFKWGEISDVDTGIEILEREISKNNIVSDILKPTLHVLYNDITNCDIKYLYRALLSVFNYNTINFYALSDLVKEIKFGKDAVLYDGESYTVFKEKIKLKDYSSLPLDYVIIGDHDKSNIHYADKDLVWNTFKSHFTK